jgi:hypothetical protein
MLRMRVCMYSRFIKNHPIRILEDRPFISNMVLSHLRSALTASSSIPQRVQRESFFPTVASVFLLLLLSSKPKEHIDCDNQKDLMEHPWCYYSSYSTSTLALQCFYSNCYRRILVQRVSNSNLNSNWIFAFRT